jgi:hypothetical protein
MPKYDITQKQAPELGETEIFCFGGCELEQDEVLVDSPWATYQTCSSFVEKDG